MNTGLSIIHSLLYLSLTIVCNYFLEWGKWFIVSQASLPSVAKTQMCLEEAMAITRCWRQSFKEGAGSWSGAMVILSWFCNLLPPTQDGCFSLGWEWAQSASNALLLRGGDWCDAPDWKSWAWCCMDTGETFQIAQHPPFHIQTLVGL